MKSYSYKARDQSGILKAGALSASNRSEALGLLRAANLIPVSVQECASGRNGKMGREFFSGVCTARGVCAVLLVAGVLFMLVKFAFPQKGADLGLKASPNAAARVHSTDVDSKPAASVPEQSAPSPAAAVKGSMPVPSTATTPTQHYETMPEPKAVMPSVMSDLLPGKSNSVPSGLSSGTERVLNAMVTARLGGPPPPLLYFPPDEAANLVAVLNRDIIVFDGDDAATVTKKENLAMVKQILKKYLKDGGSSEDFMVYYRDVLKRAYEERTEKQKAYNALRMSGEEKAASEYFEAANSELVEKGYLPLSVPPARTAQE